MKILAAGQAGVPSTSANAAGFFKDLQHFSYRKVRPIFCTVTSDFYLSWPGYDESIFELAFAYKGTTYHLIGQWRLSCLDEKSRRAWVMGIS